MSRDNNWLKFSKPCNGHALKGLVKNWWASDTSLKDNAMEASDATNSFVRNHAGVSDQVPGDPPRRVRLSARDRGQARPGAGQADRRRCLNPGCRAASTCAAGYRRG